jgi:hypothetical protein
MKRAWVPLIVLALAAGPALAFGATTTPAPAAVPPSALTRSAPAPTPTGMQVLLWTGRTGAQTIIAVELAPNTPLPATVRLPLPAGATVVWAGELSGGSVETDIERKYTTEEGTGGKVVVFRLEKFRSAQVEATHPAPQAVGDRTVSSLDWVQSAPSALTHFAVQVGPEAADVTVDPAGGGTPQTNASGERLYTVSSKALKPGEKFTMTVAYRSGAQTASGGGATGGGTTALLVVLGALLAAAISAFVVVAARMRSAERLETEEPTPDSDSRQPTGSAPSKGGDRAPEEEPDEDDPFRIDWE